MKVGAGLGTQGTLSSVLRLQACSRASWFPSLEKQKLIRNFDAQRCPDSMSERMQWCRSTYM